MTNISCGWLDYLLCRPYGAGINQNSYCPVYMRFLTKKVYLLRPDTSISRESLWVGNWACVINAAAID